jgi:spore coat protein U-like protein
MRQLLLLLLFAGRAYASPFLVCDPYPANADPSVTPATFILKGLSTNPIMTGAQVNPDGTVQLHYDLATLSFGNYTVIADAVNVFGGVSLDSAPFVFTAGIPAPPANLKIVP